MPTDLVNYPYYVGQRPTRAIQSMHRALSKASEQLPHKRENLFPTVPNMDDHDPENKRLYDEQKGRTETCLLDAGRMMLSHARDISSFVLSTCRIN